MHSLTRRSTAALAALLLLFGGVVAALAWRTVVEREQETLQHLSRGLAGHIVGHWPEVTAGADQHAARQTLMQMLMTVNPAIQVYLLDAQGRVKDYIGQPGMVRQTQVDLDAVRAFIAGARLPLHGTDPMGGGQRRVFSAAMFPARPGETSPPGYLYVVLQGPAREAAAATLADTSLWRGIGLAATLAGLLTCVVGWVVFLRLARPLAQLVRRLQAFELTPGAPAGPKSPGGDEVQALRAAFDAMAARITEQHRQAEQQAAEHREVIANLAHDLRTPLTALHGLLEGLGARDIDAARRQRLWSAALVQSRRVRQLVQQLFELATLQSIDQPASRERFRLDELLADKVQQLALAPVQRVAWQGAAPSPIEVDGDLQLIERAIANLIDNALRHAPDAEPVRLSLRCDEREVAVFVEDRGPGMPEDLRQRLNAGAPVRDPALRRHRGGGMGGLGLAIAQRVAALHGGRLRALPTAGGGTTLCLALPRVPP